MSALKFQLFIRRAAAARGDGGAIKRLDRASPRLVIHALHYFFPGFVKRDRLTAHVDKRRCYL